jgi:hypothetical protein
MAKMRFYVFMLHFLEFALVHVTVFKSAATRDLPHLHSYFLLGDKEALESLRVPFNFGGHSGTRSRAL